MLLALLALAVHAARAGSLVSIAPAGVSVGQPIVITSTGFDTTAANNSVTFTPSSGPARTATGRSIATLDTQTGLRRLTVTVPDGLPVGVVSVRATNLITNEASDARSLDIVSLELPETASASPGAAGVVVHITGSPNSQFAAGNTRVTFGAGITVRATTVDSPTSLRATIDAASNAALGPREVAVISATQSAVLAGVFRVAAANHTPTALIGGPYAGTTGKPIAFTAVGSSDPDSDPLTYTWDFGDSTSAVGITPTHTYASAATFTVNVVVADGRGGSSTATTTAVVTSGPPATHPPVARAGGPYAGATGQPVSFDGSASSDPDNNPLTFSWTFGDGGTGIGPAPTHRYATADTYNVTLTVSDGKGGAGSASTSATIAQANRAPIANAGGPYSGDAGAPIALSGLASSDPDKHALTYAWDFGDGSSGAGPTPTHTYAAAGSFSVSLTVDDGHGATSSASANAVIGPPADREPPVVSVTAPKQALPGTQFTATATAADNVGVAAVVLDVNGTNPITVSTAPYQITVHVPGVAVPGSTITVHAVARDAANNTATAQAAITIVAAPSVTAPTVTLSVPPTASPGAHLLLSARADDAVGVQSVAFSTAGQPIATSAVAPYVVPYIVPDNTPVGALLTFTAHATNFATLTADDSATITIVTAPDALPPTVSLSAPPEVEEGGVVHLSASAADDVKVASVAFQVNGVTVATFVDAPYATDFVVPPNLHAGSVLVLRVIATDTSSNQAKSDGETRVVSAAAGGSGLLAGRVYDDTTGLPVAGAAVALAGSDANGQPYNSTATSDVTGSYFLTANVGAGTLRITKSGWTRVDRTASVFDATTALVLDARLTPLTAAPQNVPAIGGGTVTAGDATITLAPGALVSDSALTGSTIGAQAIEGVLPPGWSPVGAFDLVPHGVTFTSAQAASIPNRAQLPAGTTIVLATWDEAASAWRAVAPATIGGDGSTLTGSIPATGQYAWLVADTQPSAPPKPSPGDLVAGVPSTAVPDPATIDITPTPQIIFYQPGVHSQVAAVLQTAAPLPSGTPLRSRIAESYQFTSGDEIDPEPYLEDVLFYQTPGAAAAISASYVVTPSRTFDPLQLQLGVITVELHVPDSANAQPIVGAAGAAASTATGETIQVPAGAFATAVPVELRRVAQESLGTTLPSGFDFVGAISIGFSGASPQLASVVSIPRPPQIDETSSIVLLRLVDVQGATRLVLAGIGRVAGTRIQSDTNIAGIPGSGAALSGVLAPGRYVFARAAIPIGFATGTVLDVSGKPLAGAVVSTALPIVSIAGGSGQYVALAAVGAVRVTASDARRLNIGAAQGTLTGSATVLSANVQLAAQVPAVTSLTPTDGSASVALSTAIVATFSEAIDPATISGPSGSNLVLTAPDGSAVTGAVSLTGGNTVATFRPSGLLTPNAAYTFTVSTAIKDLGGRPLASAVVAHFTSLNTLPPPAPPAGSITATIPDANGDTTVTATQGSAGVHDTVSILNLTQKTSFPALVDANGAFSATFAVHLADTLQIAITDPQGNQTVVPAPPFTKTNADGSIATVVGSAGGHVAGPGGTAVDVPAGALPDATIVTVAFVDEAHFPIQLSAAQKDLFGFSGGVQLDFGGATPAAYVNVSLPTTGTETHADRWVVGQVTTVANRTVLDVVDTARVINGRITTSSPPCPGVLAAAVYGFLKSSPQHSIGVTYGRFDFASASQNVLVMSMTQSLSFQNPGAASLLPYQSVVTSSGALAGECIPSLSGRVTVQPNSQKVVIAADQFTPADRQVVIRNRRLGQDFFYPRNVAEYRFVVAGSDEDDFRVTILSGGQQQPVTPFVTAATPGFVNVRLNMDTLNSAVSEVVVRNISKNPVEETHVPQSTAAVKLAVNGGATDGFDVTVVNAAGVSRDVQFTIESPTGGGNLVARAVTATIDPDNVVFLETYDGLTAQLKNSVQIPPGEIVAGGFTFAFDDGAVDTDTFAIKVQDAFGEFVDRLAIPNVAITISNPVTGRVVKTVHALVPPPDEPFNLGSITDDTSAPFLTSGPAFLDNFDPTGLLSFTFSEGVDRTSALNGVALQDSGGRNVTGQVRLSDDNRVVTFVPDAPLSTSASYTLKLIGLADGSGNQMAEVDESITTFTPKQTPATTFTAGGTLDVLRYLTLVKKPRADGTTQTLGFGVTGDVGATNHRTWVVLDLTDATKPIVLSQSSAGDFQRIAIVQNVEDLQFRGPPLQAAPNACLSGPTFNGDLAITSSYDSVGSSVQFWDVTDPSKPCFLGAAGLTRNPGSSSGFDAGLIKTDLGFARGIATIVSDAHVLSYTAVENAALILKDVGTYVPFDLKNDDLISPSAPGSYTDVVAAQGRLLAIERHNASLDAYDASLAALSSTSLPLADAISLAYADGVGIDLNRDGQIDQTEVLNLAFVGGSGGVAIVDVTNLASPVVVSTVAMKGAVYQLDFDPDRRRLFAAGPSTLPNGDWAVFMIDLSGANPFAQTTVTASDGTEQDARIVWRTPPGKYGGGVSQYRALRFDPDSRVLYVGVAADGLAAGGFDSWQFDNVCCDLGVDFTARPKSSSAGSGDFAGLLAREKKALQIGIAAGLNDAAACGVSIPAVSIIEQGSGACLWKPNAVFSCTDTYQPGLSDHDYEVFIPSAYFGAPGADSPATCVTQKLNARFTNDDGSPKGIDVDGVTVTFPDLTFFPVRRENFENAKLDVLPPTSGGTDATGDLGLGRQQLLLKWLLEGEYITVPGFNVAGKPLEDILTTMRTATKIALLEGYEWGNLQKFSLVKSKAFLRIAGASQAGTSLRDFYIAQLHDSGKAGIRAALARMAGDADAVALVLASSRADYASSACITPVATTTPDNWPSKICKSFEEYVASTAAKATLLTTPVFSIDQVVNQIYKFWRVKADVSSSPPDIGSENEADAFVATASTFIDAVIDQTQAAYDATIGGDPDQDQRRKNLASAQQQTDAKLHAATLHLVPRVFNLGFVNQTAIEVSMFRGTQGPGVKLNSVRVDLAEAGQEFLDSTQETLPPADDGLTAEDRNLLNLTRLDTNTRAPIFVLGKKGDPNNPPIDLDADKGNAHYAAFTIDLPEKKAREADRTNNVNGFWYYVLDRDKPGVNAPIALPDVPLPLPDPNNDLLRPNPECSAIGDLRITQGITFPGSTEESTGAAFLESNEQVTYNLHVVNDSGKLLKNVVACSSLITQGNNCQFVGNLGTSPTDRAKDIPVPYTAPSDSRVIAAIATANSPDIGVRESVPMSVYVGCEAHVVISLPNDPNPTFDDEQSKADNSKVMRGGTGLRYYQVVDRKTGAPVAGAFVTIQVTGPNGTTVLSALTNADGRIVSPNAPGIAIPVDISLKDGDQIVANIKTVDGAAPFCTGEQQFAINVTDRTFTRTWNAGASIGGEISAVKGLKGKAGAGFSFTLAETAGKGHQQLSFGRSRSAGLGLTAELLTTKVAGDVFGLHAEVGADVTANVQAVPMTSDQFDFSYPPPGTDLDPAASKALGGLILRTAIAGSDPTIEKLLDALAGNVGNLDSYKSSDVQGLTVEGSATAKAGMIVGLQLTKDAQDLGNIDYGLQQDVDGTLKLSYTVSADNRAKAKELVPTFEVKGSFDFNVALGLGSGSKRDEKDRLSLVNKLKLAITEGFARGVKFALTLDTANSFSPKKLVLSYSSAKNYGWQVPLIGQDVNLGAGGKTTIKFTITDTDVINTFLQLLVSVSQLTLQVSSGIPTPLGPAALAADLRSFIDAAIKSSGIQYEVSQDNGNGFGLPFGLSAIVAGVGIKDAKGSVNLDRTISFTKEKGPIKGGEIFALAEYTKDALIPDVPSGVVDNTDDFLHVASLSLGAVSDAVPSPFDLVTPPFSAGPVTVRSTHTAQIVFDGSAETPFQPAVLSFTFDPDPAVTAITPASVTGSADKPHYGVGGFHRFLPEDHVFVNPATLTVFYNDDEVTSFDKSTLGIYRWNEDKNDWDFLGGVADPNARTITTSVNQMGIYTAAPPMPAGTITLAAQSTTVGGNPQAPHTIVTFASGPLTMNNGQPVPDGTMFTVAGGQPASTFVPFGTVVSPDEDPLTDGVQVSAHDGAIHFTIDYPSANASAYVIVVSREGTALATQLIPLQQP